MIVDLKKAYETNVVVANGYIVISQKSEFDKWETVGLTLEQFQEILKNSKEIIKQIKDK